jgi:cytochrome c-type biogenesis protein
MSDYALHIASALWLGILTSISPCPLATNIAAISYIARRVDSPRAVLASGALYTLGRTITYVALGVLLVYSLVSAPVVSHALQKYIGKIIGPLLVIVGMFLVGLIRIGWTGGGPIRGIEDRASRMGTWGAGLLGMAFALAFCPVSAALYFGSLIPLAVQSESAVLLPTVYGIGTALPVFVFAVIIAVSARSIGRVFTAVTRVERWARLVTGIVIIGAGIYLSLRDIFLVIR